MKNFDYLKPTSAAEALRAGTGQTACFIAGGTLLVDLMRLDVERADLVVDLTGLPYAGIEARGGTLLIGALVRNTDLAEHPAVLEHFPALSQAILAGASAQIRNMATVGGNLLQRTRCSYFRDVAVSACNKRNPGSGCSAINGYSRMHSVLGVSEHCIAANPSDMNVALVALDAVVQTLRPHGGARSIPIVDFHTLPGTDPRIESVLEHGEIVTGISIPTSNWAAHSAYVKARDRASFAFALASAAAALDVVDNHVRTARVALGGVSHKPWRCAEVEQALIGKPATRETFVAASELAMRDAKTTRDNVFKLKLAPRLIARALWQARGNA